MWVPKRLKQLWEGMWQWPPWGGKIQPAQPPGGKAKVPPPPPEEDPLARAHRERPHDRELAKQHLRKFQWCYGGPQVDERLTDEVIVVSAPLLATLVLPPEAAQQVGLWISTGRELFLLCTQGNLWPVNFRFEGRVLRISSGGHVTFVDADVMPGRAIATNLAKGTTSAYRRHFLLLLPPRPAPDSPPEPKREVPDADDRDDD